MQTDDTDPEDPETPASWVGPPTLQQWVEVALADLPKRIPDGSSPLERVEAERIRQAAQRWTECGAQLAADGLTVEGSMEQLRPHPLLRIEQALRLEISVGLRKLTWVVDQRAMVERINALTRAHLAPTGKPSKGKR